jgi:hypothetical protein
MGLEFWLMLAVIAIPFAVGYYCGKQDKDEDGL